MLPILHLNEYKIANPTVLARSSPEEPANLFMGYGYRPYVAAGADPETVHQLMATTLDTVIEDLNHVPKLGYLAAYAKQAVHDKLIEHKEYITKYGDDMPEIRDWKWPAA